MELPNHIIIGDQPIAFSRSYKPPTKNQGSPVILPIPTFRLLSSVWSSQALKGRSPEGGFNIPTPS